MSKHTPGPWRVEADGNIVDQDGCDVIASHADAEGGHYLAATEEDRRLIAAVPDLLEACEALLDAVVRRDHKDKALRTARAAIAKAKGQSSSTDTPRATE